MTTYSAGPRSTHHYVVIGETHLAGRVCATLHAGSHPSRHLARPGDEELRNAMSKRPIAVAVLLHEDVAALRYALAVAHLSPTTPLIVTVFDHTVAEELSRLLPQCEVTSLADLVAPALAGPCLDPALVAVRREGDRIRAVRRDQDVLCAEDWHHQSPQRWRTRAGWALRQLRPHDAGTRLLMVGLLAVLTVLAGDWTWLVGHGHPPAEAFFEAARVVSGVGPAAAPAAAHGYQVAAALAMLSTVAFTALFTAGVVERMLGPKLIGLIGPRTLPRSGHVIVVGMGQVGMRLCVELRRLGVPVVGVERDPLASAARLARSLGVPVMTGDGGDRRMLERLRLRHARALAAVGSDDLDNIAVAIAAHGVASHTRVLIRAGEHEAIAETRSLLPMGTIRDVTGMAAAYVVARLLGEPVAGVVAHQEGVYRQSPDDKFSRSVLSAQARCRHPPAARARTLQQDSSTLARDRCSVPFPQQGAASRRLPPMSTTESAAARRSGTYLRPEGLPRRDRCLVMGILNVTPDSFSDGGLYAQTRQAIDRGLDLADQGADIVDVGGESTRPGARPVALAEELARTVPVVRELARAGVRVSIDTMHAAVARAAVEAGACLINDVSGGLADPDMASTVAAVGVPYVATHWRAPSKEMDRHADYRDVVAEVTAELDVRVRQLKAQGVDPDRIVLDPGLGFSKRSEHDWTLLAGLGTLRRLGFPLLVGASRKRFIGAALASGGAGDVPPAGRDSATAAVSALAAAAGAFCVRVHDVHASLDAVRMAAAYTAPRR
ncbi:dihydropteroate synthase [Streptomyces gilvifuscus]